MISLRRPIKDCNGLWAHGWFMLGCLWWHNWPIERSTWFDAAVEFVSPQRSARWSGRGNDDQKWICGTKGNGSLRFLDRHALENILSCLLRVLLGFSLITGQSMLFWSCIRAGYKRILTAGIHAQCLLSKVVMFDNTVSSRFCSAGPEGRANQQIDNKIQGGCQTLYVGTVCQTHIISLDTDALNPEFLLHFSSFHPVECHCQSQRRSVQSTQCMEQLDQKDGQQPRSCEMMKCDEMWIHKWFIAKLVKYLWSLLIILNCSIFLQQHYAIIIYHHSYLFP